MPLEVAPSGHLVMVTDDYGQLPKESGGIKDSKLVMLSRLPVTTKSEYNSQPEAAGNEPPSVTQLPPIPPISQEFRQALGLGPITMEPQVTGEGTAASSRDTRATGGTTSN